MTLGDFDFAQILANNKLLGPLYFIMFSLLSLILLLNMFVAIVMEGYDVVKEQEEKISILQFVRSRLGVKDGEASQDGMPSAAPQRTFGCPPAEI